MKYYETSFTISGSVYGSTLLAAFLIVSVFMKSFQFIHTNGRNFGISHCSLMSFKMLISFSILLTLCKILAGLLKFNPNMQGAIQFEVISNCSFRHKRILGNLKVYAPPYKMKQK